MSGMSKDDCCHLAQLIGGIRRATSTVKSTIAQIRSVNERYAGTCTEQLNDAGAKSLFQAWYWLDQATSTLELSVKKSREFLRASASLREIKPTPTQGGK